MRLREVEVAAVVVVETSVISETGVVIGAAVVTTWVGVAAGVIKIDAVTGDWVAFVSDDDSGANSVAPVALVT